MISSIIIIKPCLGRSAPRLRAVFRSPMTTEAESDGYVADDLIESRYCKCWEQPSCYDPLRFILSSSDLLTSLWWPQRPRGPSRRRRRRGGPQEPRKPRPQLEPQISSLENARSTNLSWKYQSNRCLGLGLGSGAPTPSVANPPSSLPRIPLAPSARTAPWGSSRAGLESPRGQEIIGSKANVDYT